MNIIKYLFLILFLSLNLNAIHQSNRHLSTLLPIILPADVNKEIFNWLQKQICSQINFLKHSAALNIAIKKQISIQLGRKTVFHSIFHTLSRCIIDSTISPLSATSQAIRIAQKSSLFSEEE
jgi:hypothetical protein